MITKATIQYTVESALAEAASTFQELAEELCNWGDNIEKKFGSTAKYDAIREAQEALEGLSEPEVPKALAGLTFEYPPLTLKRPSRPDRRDHAVGLIDRALSVLQEKYDGLSEPEPEQLSSEDAALLAELEPLIQELEELKDNAEAIEFPRAFGS